MLATITGMPVNGGKAAKTSESPGNDCYLQDQAADMPHLSSLLNDRYAPQTLSE